MIKFLSLQRADFYQIPEHKEALRSVSDKFSPDVLVPFLWDDRLIAACTDFAGPNKFAYHGNPNHNADYY